MQSPPRYIDTPDKEAEAGVNKTLKCPRSLLELDLLFPDAWFAGPTAPRCILCRRDPFSVIDPVGTVYRISLFARLFQCIMPFLAAEIAESFPCKMYRAFAVWTDFRDAIWVAHIFKVAAGREISCTRWFEYDCTRALTCFGILYAMAITIARKSQVRRRSEVNGIYVTSLKAERCIAVQASREAHDSV